LSVAAVFLGIVSSPVKIPPLTSPPAPTKRLSRVGSLHLLSHDDIPKFLDLWFVVGQRTSGCSAGPGELGRLVRLHRRLADGSVRAKASSEGARGPRDHRDSHAKSLKASGRRQNTNIPNHLHVCKLRGTWV
jgi:hypothetical protein